MAPIAGRQEKQKTELISQLRLVLYERLHNQPHHTPLRCVIFTRRVIAHKNAGFSVFRITTGCRGTNVSHLILPRISRLFASWSNNVLATTSELRLDDTVSPNRLFKVRRGKGVGETRLLGIRPPLADVVCYLNRTVYGYAWEDPKRERGMVVTAPFGAAMTSIQ